MTELDALPTQEERRLYRATGRLAQNAYAVQADIVTTREALDAMIQPWLGLERRVDGAVLFQSHAWARAVFEYEAKQGNVRFRPIIATLRDGQRLIGLLPLERIKRFGRVELMPLGARFLPYSGVLIAPGFDAKVVTARLLRAAITAGQCDMVRLPRVGSDSLLSQTMPATRLTTGGQVEALPETPHDPETQIDSALATSFAVRRGKGAEAPFSLVHQGRSYSLIDGAWRTTALQTTDYALPVSPRGMLMLQLWDKRLGSWLRAAGSGRLKVQLD